MVDFLGRKDWLWLTWFALWDHNSLSRIERDKAICKRHLENLTDERMQMLNEAVGAPRRCFPIQEGLKLPPGDRMYQFRAERRL